ncbi:MAG: hypothetical protein ACHREM_04825 [Polyangiales bacterium]
METTTEDIVLELPKSLIGLHEILSDYTHLTRSVGANRADGSDWRSQRIERSRRFLEWLGSSLPLARFIRERLERGEECNFDGYKIGHFHRVSRCGMCGCVGTTVVSILEASINLNCECSDPLFEVGAEDALHVQERERNTEQPSGYNAGDDTLFATPAVIGPELRRWLQQQIQQRGVERTRAGN